jgi:Phytanoyl-CoA hydroxylase-interacting protein C-terminus
MDQLLDRAIDAVDSSVTSPCKVLYRNKSRSYFERIKRRYGGIMAPYIKDHSGDRLSPINGQINGLFFMAEVEPGTSEPRHASAFGNTRLVVPVEALREVAPKLYFADYYCMKGKSHYVTLVMTAQDSNADNFCSQYLPSLSIAGRYHNKFFYRNSNGNYRVTDCVKVEILFTEDVDVRFLMRHRGAEMHYNIPLIGKGYTTPGGVPKRDDCQECNLYPISYDDEEEDDDGDYYEDTDGDEQYDCYNDGYY